MPGGHLLCGEVWPTADVRVRGTAAQSVTTFRPDLDYQLRMAADSGEDIERCLERHDDGRRATAAMRMIAGGLHLHQRRGAGRHLGSAPAWGDGD